MTAYVGTKPVSLQARVAVAMAFVLLTSASVRSTSDYVPTDFKLPDLTTGWYDCDIWTNAPKMSPDQQVSGKTQGKSTWNRNSIFGQDASHLTTKQTPSFGRSTEEEIQDAFAEIFSTRDNPLGIHESIGRAVLANGSNTDPILPDGDLAAECRRVHLPLMYKTGSGNSTKSTGTPDEFVEVFIKRIKRPSGGKPTRQIWNLQGGPGGSSASLESQMVLMNKALNADGHDWDIYTLDHRGVGRSDRLSCIGPQAETIGSAGGIAITNDEFFNCLDANVKHLGKARLQAFSLTNAAKDLGTLMSTAQQQLGYSFNHVYGISYGTMWSSRYMQLYPTQATSVTIDGIVSTKGPFKKRLTIDTWDYWSDKVGLDLLTLYCDGDAFCQGKFSAMVNKTGGWEAFVSQTVQGADTCLAGSPTAKSGSAPSDVVRNAMGVFLIVPLFRPYITALLYRLSRCNDDDIKTVSDFFTRATAMLLPPTTCRSLDSNLLQTNIVAPELWKLTEPLPTYDSEFALFKASSFGTCGGCDNALRVKNYPKYDLDQYFNNTPVVQFPVLMLNGDVDPQTAIYSAREQARNLQANPKIFIEIPYAVHYSIMRSPTYDGSNCGFDIFISFLKDPNNVDRSCLDRLVPIDWKGKQETNEALWGTGDIYDGIPAQNPSPSPESSPSPTPKDKGGDTVSKSTFTVVSLLLALTNLVAIGAIVILVSKRRARSHSDPLHVPDPAASYAALS